MGPEKKKTIQKVLIPLGAALLLLALAAAFSLSGARRDRQPEASLLSGQVDRGDIRKTVSGSGTLTEQEAAEVELPSGVKITDFLVSNGETVTEGQALATVDRVSVMEAVSSVQETLDHLTEEMESATWESGAGRVTAPAAGRVMAVYVQAGDRAEDALLAHGSLIELSMDGLLAVELRSDTKVEAGTAVTVLLEDETEVPGQVERDLDGSITVTLSDAGPTLGQTVTVFTGDRTELGSGTLCTHMPWHAWAVTGTVSSVPVREGEKVAAGQTLLRLSDTDFSVQYNLLASQRREYEDLMLELFLLYQDQAVTAPCGGVVSGIEKDSAALLSASGGGFVTLLANKTPTGDDENAYTNRIGMVTEIYQDGSFGLLLQKDTWTVSESDDFSDAVLEADISAGSMTMTGSVQPGSAPVYTYQGGIWQPYGGEIVPGDVLLFAYNDTEGGTLTWMIWLGRNEIAPEKQQPQTPESGGQGQMPSGDLGAAFPGGGDFSFGGGDTREEEFALFSLEKTPLLQVTPQEELTVPLSIDELDILSLALGQTAEITVDALPGQSFTGTVTGIDTAGLSSGGNSKYAVEITLPRTENMLGGMNATVTVTVAVRENVLRVPAEALTESVSGTLLYRSLDGDGALSDPVAVETGLSDGAYVELLSGLGEGDSFWYTSYGAPGPDTSLPS